jgi:hypothetical protein
MRSFITCIFTKYIYNNGKKEDEICEACSTRGNNMNANRVLVMEPEERRPRCRREDNIMVDVREKRWGGMDCTGLVQDREKWRVL